MAALAEVENGKGEVIRSQMTKFGWLEGKGLGRNEQGKKEAIKVSLKNNKNGLGLDPSEQFVFHWWDHVFNKVASSIKIEEQDEEVLWHRDDIFMPLGHNKQVAWAQAHAPPLASCKKFWKRLIGKEKFHVTDITGQRYFSHVKISRQDKTENIGQISYKKPTNAAKGKELLYGRFVRSSTSVVGSELVKSKDKEGCSSDESDDDEEPNDLSRHDTLEKAFQMSGGRTAHKAARHGHKLNGKLKRLQDQESSLESSNEVIDTRKLIKTVTDEMSCSKDGEDLSVEKRPKKAKNKKKSKDLDFEETQDKVKKNKDFAAVGMPFGDGLCMNKYEANVNEEYVQEKKKKKRKRDAICLNDPIYDKDVNGKADFKKKKHDPLSAIKDEQSDHDEVTKQIILKKNKSKKKKKQKK